MDQEGASEQTPCALGKYSGAAAIECSDCDAGTFADEEGSSTCIFAAAGYVVASDGASEEVECPAGTFSVTAATECSDCPAGYYTDQGGESSCLTADAGYYVASDGASEQTRCEAGRVSESFATECRDCEDGTYADSEGMSTCTLADAGTYVAHNQIERVVVLGLDAAPAAVTHAGRAIDFVWNADSASLVLRAPKLKVADAWTLDFAF